MLHPYAAVAQLIELYRDTTGVAGGGMIAGRGASEFIWAMCRELDHASVKVPMPAYTDYLKRFRAGDSIPLARRSRRLSRLMRR